MNLGGLLKIKERPPAVAGARFGAVAAFPVWNGKTVGATSFYCLIAIAAKCTKSLLPRAADPSYARAAARRCAARFMRAFSVPDSEAAVVAEAFLSARNDASPVERYIDILLRAKDVRPGDVALRLLDFVDDKRLPYSHAVFHAYARIAPHLLGGAAEEAARVAARHFTADIERLRTDEAPDKEAIKRQLYRTHPDKYALTPPPKLIAKAVQALYAECADAYKRDKPRASAHARRRAKISDSFIAAFGATAIKAFFDKRKAARPLARIADATTRRTSA